MKIQRFKYKKKKIIIRHCENSNIHYYIGVIQDKIIIYISDRLDNNIKSKILHSAIKQVN